MRLQLIGGKKVKGFEQQKAKHQAFNKKAVPEEPAEEEVEEEVTLAEEVQDDADTPLQEEAPVEEAEDAAAVDEVEEEVKELEPAEGEEEEDEEEEKREIETLMKEEDINAVPEDVDLAEVDKLTGLPKANDMVVALVPMCAPYSAISTYKYKVKLQQGTLKRGKAQKLIKNLFQQQATKTASAQEAGMVRNLPDPDMTNMLINNVRVLAPGLTKVQNQTKQAKRSGPKKE